MTEFMKPVLKKKSKKDSPRKILRARKSILSSDLKNFSVKEEIDSIIPGAELGYRIQKYKINPVVMNIFQRIFSDAPGALISRY